MYKYINEHVGFKVVGVPKMPISAHIVFHGPKMAPKTVHSSPWRCRFFPTNNSATVLADSTSGYFPPILLLYYFALLLVAFVNRVILNFHVSQPHCDMKWRLWHPCYTHLAHGGFK